MGIAIELCCNWLRVDVLDIARQQADAVVSLEAPTDCVGTGYIVSAATKRFLELAEAPYGVYYRIARL